jgi:integrase/recombinase XerD
LTSAIDVLLQGNNLHRKVVVRPVNHYGNTVAGLFFERNFQLQKVLRTIPGVRFSRTCACWIVPFRPGLEKEIEDALRSIAEVDVTALVPKEDSVVIKECPEAFREMLVRKRYGSSTIKNYVAQFTAFINHFPEVSIDNLQQEHIKKYMHYLIEVKRVSSSTQNVVINAIKFYYEQVLHRERSVYALERPVKEKRLPIVLSEEEVKAILTSCENLKHKAMLYVLYAAGLRRSEVIQLKVADVDESRKVIFVRMGKGKKDRITMLSDKVCLLLAEYRSVYNPKDWLFEGADGEAYSESSLQKVFKAALARSGVKKQVSLHSLRHSFATHLLEHGTDIRYIQALLGHGSSRTTEIYTHITRKGFEKIRSPLDNLDL